MNTILKTLGTLKFEMPSRDLKDAVGDYLTLRVSQNLRKSSSSQISTNLKLMVSKFSPIKCDKITTTMLESWFSERQWKRSTIDGVIAKIGPFFTWCIREGWCSKNPVRGILRPKADDSEPVIFTVEEVERLMIVAHQIEPSMIPYLALGIFAGVRPEEIQRLSWEDIGEDEIEIRSIKAKTRRRRLIEIAPNLRQWLCLGGPIAPKNKRRKLDRLRKETGVTWAHDIMRHTFASYHLAKHGSGDKTSVQLGHSDTQMLITHYRKLVSKDNAERFWSISPLP
jgi:integrase